MEINAASRKATHPPASQVEGAAAKTMLLRLEPAATNATPGLTPDTVHAAASPKATPSPPVAGVAAKDQLSHDVEA